ncbi:amino acid transporter [Ligilactobacillus hayakitensis DSM 18933 = JCM 14209]|uniref:Amino acid transporter n=1 Tax=Ligilactobacillus hayakitensis DSM 18933 = JCM 14209 TaxID=1423755 RepID=A0A0R1WP38_9LACO|nr:amino acid permease [Ligilactobacillus hayakitensis]KRM19648.1 amino acid transporter [Ligilactobacillus hayakitensis DSM 18933 = JCM 14209]
MGIKDRIFKKESLSRYIDSDQNLERVIGFKDLIAMGIGVVIGTGIFILPGTVAATHSGPAITLSFVLAAIVCSLSALCYAEFASAMPVAGSAYSFGNVIFGELIGWILGWALVLEYMLAVAAVATGWSAYFNSFISGFGLHIPKVISGPFDPAHGTYFNLVAILIVLFIAFLLSRGVKDSVKLNNIMVYVKIAIIITFIVVGAFFVKPANWNPYLPFGWTGVYTGAATVFFAYLGFDVIASSAAEVKNPKRTMPAGILGTLLITTVLYTGVSAVLTGMVKYTKLDVANPVSYAMQVANQNWFAGLIAVGALVGMFTMILSTTFSSSRLIYSIGRDGLLPSALGKLDEKTHTPLNALYVVTFVIVLASGFLSLDQLANLVNIGTLIAFFFVSLGVIPLRKRQDIKNEGGFKVPFYPVLPIISAALCFFMLTQLSIETWEASAVWFIVGLVIYFSYGMKHSKLAEKND